MKLGQIVLDQETPTRHKVLGSIAEARHLLRLRSQVRDRVVDQVHESSIVTDLCFGHVTDRYQNTL